MKMVKVFRAYGLLRVGEIEPRWTWVVKYLGSMRRCHHSDGEEHSGGMTRIHGVLCRPPFSTFSLLLQKNVIKARI